MPLDYSKWDKLELSDDEDFECHPNVDKKSMIRWKQAQIHKERQETQDQRDLLKLELETSKRFLNDVPKKVADLTGKSATEIVLFLDKFAKEVDKDYTDPMRKESLGRMEKWPQNWDAPVWGDVLKSHVPWNEEIMRIGKEMEEFIKKQMDSEDLARFIQQQFDITLKKIEARQVVIENELARLAEKVAKKITSDDLVTGFDKTVVSQKKLEESSVAPAADSGKAYVEETIHTPNATQFSNEMRDLIFQEFESSDEDLIGKHPKLVEISRAQDYGTIFNILKANPVLLKNESLEEALLLRALCNEIIGNAKEAKNNVMVSLIMKFTRSIGDQGLELFFNKLSGPSSSSQNLFFGDLETTYAHIQKRGKILRAEKMKDELKLREQQQTRMKLYEKFKQPDGTLKLPIGENPTEMELKQAAWFDPLPEYYKEGLLLEDIDKINQYLSSLDPEEADYQAKLATKAGFIQMEEDSA